MSCSLTRIVRLMAVASALLAPAAVLVAALLAIDSTARAQGDAPPGFVTFYPPESIGGFTWAPGGTATDGTVIAALGVNGVAIYCRTGVSPTWELQDVVALLPGSGTAWVAVDHERLVVGQSSAEGFPDGVARVFRRSGSEWIEEAALTPEGGFPTGGFGAAVDIDADTLVAGAPADGPGGAVYVFTREGDAWTQRARLVAADEPAGGIGGAVGLSGDVLVVGASNAAYVFAGRGEEWSQQAKLTGPVPGNFGCSVAADGETVVVGAYSADTIFAPTAGAAYAFARSGTTWVLQGELSSPGGELGDMAGVSVGLSGDEAISGAPFAYDWWGNFIQAGEVQGYTRSGGNWTYSGSSLLGPWGAPGKVYGFAVGFAAGIPVALAPGYMESMSTMHVLIDVYSMMPTWIDLGYGLAGIDGIIPRLSGSGTLQGGSPGELLLEHAAPSALVLGLFSPALAPTPFKGGTLVPLPPQISLLAFTTSGGVWRAQWSSWLSLPYYSPFYMQFAVADPAAPNGVAMSNAIAGITH